LQYICHISFQVFSFVLYDDILKQFWLCTCQNCNVSEAPYWLMLLFPVTLGIQLQKIFFFISTLTSIRITIIPISSGFLLSFQWFCMYIEKNRN
jgi:hypothetical protein